MKDQANLYITGFPAATLTALGPMLYQAINVEDMTRADTNPDDTQFIRSVIEDFNDKGEVKSCCWNGKCARLSVLRF